MRLTLENGGGNKDNKDRIESERVSQSNERTKNGEFQYSKPLQRKYFRKLVFEVFLLLKA